MSDGGDGDDGGGTPFANSPTYDPSSPAESPGGGGGGGDNEAAQQQAPAAAEGEADVNTIWEAIQDDEGRTYYYNEATGETQWERPEEGPTVIVVEEEDMEAEAEAEAEVDAEQRREGEQQEQGASEPMEEGEYVAEGDDGVEADSTKAAMEVEQVPEEEAKDPKQVALEKAEEALTKTDAVMELGKSYIHAFVQPWYLSYYTCINMTSFA